MGCILISSNRRGGRCWQRLEDRWWWVVGLRMGRIGGWVAGQISSLQLWRRNKLNWQWQMNHLLFPNCLFYASQIPFSLSVSFPFPHHFLHEHPLLLSSSLSPTKLFFSSLPFPFPTLFYFWFVLPMMPFHSSASQNYFPLFSFLLCWCEGIVDFGIWRGPAALCYCLFSQFSCLLYQFSR